MAVSSETKIALEAWASAVRDDQPQGRSSLARALDVLKTGVSGDRQERKSRLACKIVPTERDLEAEKTGVAVRKMVAEQNAQRSGFGIKLYQALCVGYSVPMSGKYYRSIYHGSKKLGIPENTLRHRLKVAEEIVEAKLRV